MTLKQVLKEVRKIEIKTKKLVEGLLQGNYHSVFKGSGIEFSEVREYKPGDDIRTIDWNVTARMNKAYVKEYIEERNLNVFILLDVSGSNDFGLNKSKKRTGVEIAATIMFAAVKNNDNIGLTLFTDKTEKYFKPRKGRKHALRLIREMIYYNPKSKKTNIKEALKFIIKIVKKQSIIFVISDFIENNDQYNYLKELKIINKKHDLILIRIMDNRELEIPEIGFIELSDEETGESIIINTSDKEFQENYKKMIKNKIREFDNKMKKLRIDTIKVNTEEGFVKPLEKFFYIREKRMKK